RRIREKEITQYVSPIQRAGGRGHYQGADGGWSHLPLCYGWYSRGSGNSAEQVAGAVRGGRSCGGITRSESFGGELPFGFARLWPARGGRGGAACQATVRP